MDAHSQTFVKGPSNALRSSDRVFEHIEELEHHECRKSHRSRVRRGSCPFDEPATETRDRCTTGCKQPSQNSPANPKRRRQSATRSDAGPRCCATAMTAFSRSTTMPPNGHCAQSHSVARITCSPVPTRRRTRRRYLQFIGSAKLNELDPEAYLRKCWPASPIIRSLVSQSYCPGMSAFRVAGLRQPNPPEKLQLFIRNVSATFACARQSKMRTGGEPWTGCLWTQASSLQPHTFLPSACSTCVFAAANSTAISTSRHNSIGTSWPPIPKANTSRATSVTDSPANTFLLDGLAFTDNSI